MCTVMIRLADFIFVSKSAAIYRAASENLDLILADAEQRRTPHQARHVAADF